MIRCLRFSPGHTCWYPLSVLFIVCSSQWWEQAHAYNKGCCFYQPRKEMITNSLTVCICLRNTQQGSVTKSKLSYQMHSTYMYKHQILLLNLGTGTLRELRENRSQIWICSCTPRALSAVGQGDLLNKPGRSTANLKFPDSLWDRGLDPHMRAAMQIIYFLPYKQKFSAHISGFQTGTHIRGSGRGESQCILLWVLWYV